MRAKRSGWSTIGLASLVSVLVLGIWVQLTPLGSAPDEASHFIKSAAVVRGQLTGEDVPGWLVSIDGWVYDDDVGVRNIVVVGGGDVVAREPANMKRDDVNTQLGLEESAIVGYSIWVLTHELREPYSIFAELNDDRIVALDLLDGANVVTSPVEAIVEGRRVGTSSSTRGLVEDSHFNGRMEYSHWSTIVDIDPQFDGANAVQRCFVSQAAQPGCGLRVEDQTPSTERPITAMGRYTPAMYVVSGVGSLIGATNAAWYLARFVSALAAGMLIALTVTVLMRRRLSLLPLVAALPPAVLFLSSVVNPSGLEIIGAIAVWVALPGVLKGDRRDRFEVACLTLGAVVLILSRPLGMVYFAVIVAVCVIADGSLRRALQAVSRHRVVAAVQLATLVASTWWYLFVYDSSVDAARAAYLAPDVPLAEQIAHALGDVYRVLLEAVGDLGSLEVPVPRLVFIASIVSVVWLIGVSWSQSVDARALRHLRTATVCLLVVSVLLVIATDINYYRILRGYGVQGRHLTPWLVGIPLLAARHVRLSRSTVSTLLGVWVLGQILAGFTALRRYSVGLIGDNFFAMFSDPVWVPPLGVVPTLALLGVVLIAAAALIHRYESSRDTPETIDATGIDTQAHDSASTATP